MNKNYYVTGSVIGILCAIIVAWLMMGKDFFRFFYVNHSVNVKSSLPILIAIAVILYFASRLDKFNLGFNYRNSGLLFPLIIFVSGVVVGCLANWMILGNFSDPIAYILAPLYWLMVIGAPSSLVIGSVYYFIQKKRFSSPD